MFPEGAGYEHDQLERRGDLTSEERAIEPQNRRHRISRSWRRVSAPVSAYVNRPQEPVCFVDSGRRHRRPPAPPLTSIVGFTRESSVARLRIGVPVSNHPVDSVNLKDPKLGIYDQIDELVRRTASPAGASASSSPAASGRRA
jgi:hypothetical protein